MLKQVNIRLDDEFIKQVKIKCLELDMTFQDAVKEALENWVKKK